MQSKAETVEQYINELPDERKGPISTLHKTILANLPKGLDVQINYGMIGYVVPHRIYPNGYHCNPQLPLPFMGIASQKNAISFYHMGLYADNHLLDWFKNEYPKHSKTKLDMGKSCIRFKKPEHIPYDLMAELVKKMSVNEWIEVYEKGIKK
jgi:hypothetical protein